MNISNLAMLADSIPFDGDYNALRYPAVVVSGSDEVERRERVQEKRGIDPKSVAVARIERPPAPDQPAPEEVTPVTQRTYEDLARELIELEKQFPLPEKGESLADAKWFEERWGKSEFEPYRGMCIAVLNGSVVGQGRNPLQLQLDVARQLKVHPQRFIIEYIPPRNF